MTPNPKTNIKNPSSLGRGREAHIQDITHILEFHSELFPLPDILRIFNVNLTGFAISTGDARSTNAGFNQAVTRAKAKYGSWGVSKNDGT